MVSEPTDNSTTRAIRRPEFWILLAMLLASLVLRTLVLHADRVVRWDEPDYLILGRNLFTGQGYTVSGRPELHYVPLFPIVTGVLYPLTHNMKLNSDIAFVLFGSLLLLPFYWLSKRLSGVRVAVMAAIFLCLFPALTAAVPFWGTMLEPLYLFVLFAAFAAIWLAWEQQGSAAAPQRGSGACVAAGGLFGLAYLTKPEAILYVVLMFGLLLLGNALRRSLWNWRTILGILTGLLAFVLVIWPYMSFLYQHTGRIMITGKLGVTYVAGQGAVDRDPGLYDRALSRLDEAEEEIIWFSPDRFKYSIWDIIKADPLAFLRRTWQNINTLEELLFAREVFPFYFLVFLAVGWFAAPWDRSRAAKEVFLVACVLPVLIFLPFHIELRYFAPMLPVLLLWLARGIVALAAWLQQTWENLRSASPPLRYGDAPQPQAAEHLGLVRPGRGRLSLALSILLLILISTYFLVLQSRVVNAGLAGMNPSRRQAGLWLKANSPADALIMSRDTEVPFYAERRWAAAPNEEYERFIAYVRKRGADYLIVDEREVTVIRPQLRLLLDEASPPPELQHVYTADDARGKTIVYKVLY